MNTFLPFRSDSLICGVKVGLQGEVRRLVPDLKGPGLGCTLRHVGGLLFCNSYCCTPGAGDDQDFGRKYYHTIRYAKNTQHRAEYLLVLIYR